MTRVFIVDDHELVRIGLRFVLEEAGMEVVGTTGSAAEATGRIPVLAPDVCVLDYRLSDGTGVQVCRDLQAVDPSLKCLILTGYDDDEALRTAVIAGASGYVLKEVNSRSLLDAVRRAAAGKATYPPGVEARLRKGLTCPATNPSWSLLTGGEQQVLDLIAKGLTNPRIAKELSLTEESVRNSVSAILAKLEVKRPSQAPAFLTPGSPGPSEQPEPRSQPQPQGDPAFRLPAATHTRRVPPSRRRRGSGGAPGPPPGGQRL